MTRKYHPMKFTYLTPASNTYKLSFYARTISELNSVSAQVIDQPSAEAFRTTVISFFILIVI